MKDILHTLFEMNDVPMLLCNLEWDVVYANSKAKQVVGIADNSSISLFNAGLFNENDLSADLIVQLLNKEISFKHIAFQSAQTNKVYTAKIETFLYEDFDYLAVYFHEHDSSTSLKSTADYKDLIQIDFTKPVLLKADLGVQTIQNFATFLGYQMNDVQQLNQFVFSKIKSASFEEVANAQNGMVQINFSVLDFSGNLQWFKTVHKPSTAVIGNKPYNILYASQGQSMPLQREVDPYTMQLPDFYYAFNVSNQSIVFSNKLDGYLDYSTENWMYANIQGVDENNTITTKGFIDKLSVLKDKELSVAFICVFDKNKNEEFRLILKGKRITIDNNDFALVSVINLYDAKLPLEIENNTTEASFIPSSFYSASVPMALCTLKFEFVKINKSAERLLNYKSEELEGKTLSHISLENELSFDIRQFHRLVKREIDSYNINRTYKGNGVLLDALINASIVTLNGVDYILGILLENKRDYAQGFLNKDSFSIFNSILAINPDIHFIFDVDKRSIIYQNTSILNYLGYSNEDLKGADILKFFESILEVNAETKSKLLKCVASKDFEENKYRTVEFHVRAKSGELKYFRLRGTVLLNDANNFLNYGILQDLTKQKRTEIALDEQENLNNLVANLMPDFLIVSNVDTLEHVHTNFNGRTLLGYSEFDWNRLRNIKVDPAFEGQVVTQMRALKEMRDGEMLMDEVKFIDINNQSKWVSLKSKVFKRNPKTNEIELILTIVADIDAQKKMLEDLVLSENKNSALLTAIPDLILVVDRNGGYTQAFSGLQIKLPDVNTLIGATVYDAILDKDIADLIMQNVNDCIDTNEVRFIEFRYDDVEEESYYSNHFSKYSDNEAIVLVRNISKRKRAEKQLAEKVELLSKTNEELEQYIAKNTELERFAYIVSHDLKEPLRSITAFSDILKTKLKAYNDPKLDELTNYLMDGALRMNNTIEGVLRYSRLDRLNEPLNEVNVDEILKQITDDLNFLVQEKNATLNVKKMQPIVGHEIQIRQLFQNLINNGLKFNKSKKPKVEVGVDVKEDNVWFYVKDNGIGIAEENRENVFKMFKRLHSNKEYQGQGIGLSICKKIVDRHEGQIKIESNDWGGTTFLFTLGKN